MNDWEDVLCDNKAVGDLPSLNMIKCEMNGGRGEFSVFWCVMMLERSRRMSFYGKCTGHKIDDCQECFDAGH